MTDYDGDEPESDQGVWVDLWSPSLTRFSVWVAVTAVGGWILIRLLTP